MRYLQLLRDIFALLRDIFAPLRDIFALLRDIFALLQDIFAAPPDIFALLQDIFAAPPELFAPHHPTVIQTTSSSILPLFLTFPFLSQFVEHRLKENGRKYRILSIVRLKYLFLINEIWDSTAIYCSWRHSYVS